MIKILNTLDLWIVKNFHLHCLIPSGRGRGGGGGRSGRGVEPRVLLISSRMLLLAVGRILTRASFWKSFVLRCLPSVSVLPGWSNECRNVIVCSLLSTYHLHALSWTRLSTHMRTVSQQVHPPMHACAPFFSSLRPSIKRPVKPNKLVAHFHFHVCEWTFVPGDHRAHIGDRASVRRTGFEPCRCLAHQWLRKRMFLVALKVLINVI